MKKFIIAIYALAILTGTFLTGCDEDDFLNTQAVGSVDENALANEDGVNQLLIAAYSVLNDGYNQYKRSPMNCITGVIHGAEAYKGTAASGQAHLLEFSQYGVTTGNTDVLDNFRWMYDGVDRANTTLKVLARVEGMSEADMAAITAEARFLRGYFHWQLKRTFNNVPYIDDTVEDERVPNFDEDGNYVNIWPQIAADLDFARKNLPPTQSEVGRPNKWAADILYAKILIYRADAGEYPGGYSEALTILKDAIDNGVTSNGLSYDLLANYHDNFDAATRNGAESVWAVQTSTNDGTNTAWFGSPNALGGAQWWNSNNPSGPGLGTGWGNYQPTEWFANHFRVDEGGLPYLDMFDTNSHELKDDYGLAGAPNEGEDPFEIDTAPVDPRLDWSVGRRGIPFLGHGDFPGTTWIRSQAHGGPYFMKKFHVWFDQYGTYTADNAYPAINIPVLRFAEVLLLAAECEARVGSLDNARSYVNRVRQRMIENSDNPHHWVKREDGSDAANYSIGVYPTGGAGDAFQSKETALDAILYERTLELGFEGERFFDVVRYGKGAEEFNAFIDFSKERYGYLAGAQYTETPDAYIPIPRDAIDNSKKDGVPTLKQNEGY